MPGSRILLRSSSTRSSSLVRTMGGKKNARAKTSCTPMVTGIITTAGNRTRVCRVTQRSKTTSGACSVKYAVHSHVGAVLPVIQHINTSCIKPLARKQAVVAESRRAADGRAIGSPYTAVLALTVGPPPTPAPASPPSHRPSTMGAYTRSRRLVPTTKFHRRAQMSVADVDRNGLSKCGARVSPKALAANAAVTSKTQPSTA
mmetsp:Transcript_18332/g.29276  ORF Transcript_18332/g.29276 Transcript_18332/m.29276 type:complete len:202 (+) Transcript_18332:218-823(+)